MYKPASLRQHLTQAVPELALDPDKLSILVRQGRLICTGAKSLSFEYAYTLQIIVLDYAADADAIMLPLLVWLSTHQPEISLNEDKREKAVRFEVEYLNATSIDLMIELDLTERVIVAENALQSGPGSYSIRHVGEPPLPDMTELSEHWEFWLRDQKIAEWGSAPTGLQP